MKKKTPLLFICVAFGILLSMGAAFSQEKGKPLILQEMSWVDVEEHLKTTDYYEALGISKMISARTGVLVAPVVLAGYSVYHSGFAGSLSLKPETLEQVLFETAEILIKYGFRRFMFFNYHGGNQISQSKVIHRINHGTEAIAVAIGVGSSIQKTGYQLEGVTYDAHAGISETSMMLFLEPDLVKIERAEKPEMYRSPMIEKIFIAGEKNPELLTILGALQGVPEETKKGGASHELTSNGIWSTADPKKSTKEIGEKSVNLMVDYAVKFIESWKTVKK
jgi:creatinine amidohydrolase